MSKSKIGKCRRATYARGRYTEQPWFIARRKRNRVRNKMAKRSRGINRS
jgi:hypothetical protein